MESFIRHGGLPPIYQCDRVHNWTDERWLEEGTKRLPLGIFDIIFGTCAIILYIPCSLVLLQPELRRFIAYKLLFLISMIDIYLLVLNSVLNGILLIKGAVFCNHPLLLYHLGTLALPAWMGFCSSSLVLGFTRIVDLWNPKRHDQLFGGKRALISFIFIFAYMIFAYLYGKPILFNSKHMTWTFDPFIHTDGSHVLDYVDYVTVVNNVFTITLALLLSFIFIVFFIYKSVFYGFKLSSIQKQMFFQSLFVSLNAFLASGIFVSYMFLPVDDLVNYLGLQFWQLATAGDLFLFLGINATTRKAVKMMLLRFLQNFKKNRVKYNVNSVSAIVSVV